MGVLILGIDLINMNARLYDPVLGRFISADSIVPDATNWDDYNRYMYVRGNPMKYTDPSGHSPKSKDRSLAADIDRSTALGGSSSSSSSNDDKDSDDRGGNDKGSSGGSSGSPTKVNRLSQEKELKEA